MNNESANTAEATLGTAITQCLNSGLLGGPGLTWAAVERAIEPVAAAVFELAAGGTPPETVPILTSLGLTGEPRHWAARTLERDIEAGECKRQIFAPGGGLLVLDDAAVQAIACRAAWIPFERYHEDDAKPEANSMTVWEMAKNLARRGRAVFGYPVTPAEAAWAVMTGYAKAGIIVSRDAWKSALQGAQSGVREASIEEDYRLLDNDQAGDRVGAYLEGAAA
jgi:hypothetical protein